MFFLSEQLEEQALKFTLSKEKAAGDFFPAANQFNHGNLFGQRHLFGIHHPSIYN